MAKSTKKEETIVPISKEKKTEEKKTKKNVRSTSIDHKCPNCSAKLTFDIKTQKWVCKYCDSIFTLEELQARLNNAATDKKNDDSDLIEDDDTVYVQYNCPDCGAEIIADELTASTFCIYCGNTAILKNKLAGKFRPDYIIPFKKTEDEAKEAFIKLAKSKPFTPTTFIDKKNIEKIRGVYIPFWLYNITLTGSVVMNGTTSRSWVSGDRHYTETRYFDLIREGSMKFNRIPVDGSSRFDDALMNTIEPFDYGEMKPYNHAYLSGFIAEKYDIDKTLSFRAARDRAFKSADVEFIRSGAGYSCTIKNKNYFPRTDLCEYVLLPVYMVNVKYLDKYYTFAMNGQTGEFVGNVPISKAKAFYKSAIAFTIAFAILFAISYLVFLFVGGR